jgi:glycosyltransferase involved in cell wall biosynthesis
LEAMASGCPVVVANTSSLPEVCGDAACYVNPYSIESIAVGMGKVLNDAAYRDSLKQKGYVQAKKYNWTNSASAIIKIFEEVYNETRHYS